jgi:hypothetical protein
VRFTQGKKSRDAGRRLILARGDLCDWVVMGEGVPRLPASVMRIQAQFMWEKGKLSFVCVQDFAAVFAKVFSFLFWCNKICAQMLLAPISACEYRSDNLPLKS